MRDWESAVRVVLIDLHLNAIDVATALDFICSLLKETRKEGKEEVIEALRLEKQIEPGNQTVGWNLAVEELEKKIKELRGGVRDGIRKTTRSHFL